MKIALLVAGPVSDKGWNGLAHDAVQKLAKDTGAQVTEQQTKSKGEIEAALRNFAAGGYDLIVAHGNEYGDPAIQVAKDFPKAHFVISSGRVEAPNVTSLIYKLEDATYVLGEMAAQMSKTGKAACIGGMEFPPVASTFYGFEQGAHAVKPGFKVTTAYLNSWDDVVAGKAQASTLINQGNDFLFHNADAAGQGVFQAVQAARKDGKDAWAFGSNADQSEIAPDAILASAVLDPTAPLEEIVKEIQENRFQGKKRLVDMKSGGVTVVLNPKLAGQIPPDVKKRLEETEAAIKSGRITVKQSG
jgi:basic membrane lipoprotein Med (substrate-binding protein (PBP1-ABC) superfamily)